MIRPRSFVEWVMFATTTVGTWLVVFAVVSGPWWLWPVGLLLVVAAAELFGLRLWVEVLRRDNERLRMRAREYLVESVRARLVSGLPTNTRERAREERG